MPAVGSLLRGHPMLEMRPNSPWPPKSEAKCVPAGKTPPPIEAALHTQAETF